MENNCIVCNFCCCKGIAKNVEPSWTLTWISSLWFLNLHLSGTVARLTVKSEHESKTCYVDIRECAQYISTIEHTWKGICIMKWERESSLWPVITSTAQLWFWKLKWKNVWSAIAHHIDNSQFDPTIKSLCGVVSAHNKAAYIRLKEGVICLIS